MSSCGRQKTVGHLFLQQEQKSDRYFQMMLQQQQQQHQLVLSYSLQALWKRQ